MTVLITIGMIIVAAALLTLGLVANSSWAFVGAAALSAVAIVMLWKRVGKTRDAVFVTGAASPVAPSWDTPLRSADGPEPEDDDISAYQLPPVAIEQYEDLVASEIMPSLETLSIEQLQAIIEREKAGLGRPIIISRAETLIDLTRGVAHDHVDLRGPDSGRRPRRELGKEKGISLE